MFKGSFVAIITPFKDGKIDVETYSKLIDFQIKNGTSGIIPCGTTGESATLSFAEHKELVKLTVQIVNKKVPVIAGTGSNSTAEAIELTKSAKDDGVDAALVLTPYYNKPTQEGLYQHYKAIAENVNIPIVIYNVPGRTAVSINPETIARLCEFKNIVALKDATGNLDYTSKVLDLCDICLLSGDDSLTLPMMSLGAKGVISVVANIMPKETAELVSSFMQGDLNRSRELHFKLFNLIKTLFIETNPIPIKAAAEMMGLVGKEIRLPLVPMSDKNRELLKEEMKKLALL